MTWKNNYSVDEPSIEDGMTSKFNEAFLKMHRFHKIQELINSCFVNPLAFNLEYNTYNYEVIFNNCNNILSECWGKLNDTEKKETTELMNAIEKMMNDYPIHDIQVNQIDNKREVNINKDNWIMIKKWLFQYNLKIRELMSRTGYDSPNKDEWDEESL